MVLTMTILRNQLLDNLDVCQSLIGMVLTVSKEENLKNFKNYVVSIPYRYGTYIFMYILLVMGFTAFMCQSLIGMVLT